MQKVIAYSSVLFASLLFAEPSAFDAPAGQALASTPNSPQNVLKQPANQANTPSVSELKSNVEGLQSLVVGQGEQLNELNRQFAEQITSDQPTSLKELNKRFEENLKLQNENFDKINTALGQLAQMIDNISETYVSKEQLKLNMGKNYKDLKSKAQKTQIDTAKQAKEASKVPEANASKQATPEPALTTPTPSASKANLDEVYANAIKEYKANNLEQAKAKFVELSNANYPKQAVVEYYLGEIAYKNADYKTAIGYYQKSVEADEKSSFVPMILYHTAYSLEKLGDKASAKKILQSLITNYPDNYLVPAAKKRLAELK